MSRAPFETMPDMLDAKQLAKALQISKAGAYNLLNSREKSMRIRRFYENRAYQEVKDNHDLF